jgi:hypothetical protein
MWMTLSQSLLTGELWQPFVEMEMVCILELRLLLFRELLILLHWKPSLAEVQLLFHFV